MQANSIPAAGKFHICGGISLFLENEKAEIYLSNYLRNIMFSIFQLSNNYMVDLFLSTYRIILLETDSLYRLFSEDLTRQRSQGSLFCVGSRPFVFLTFPLFFNKNRDYRRYAITTILTPSQAIQAVAMSERQLRITYMHCYRYIYIDTYTQLHIKINTRAKNPRNKEKNASNLPHTVM